MAITGVIDGAPSMAKFDGWARDADGASPLTIEAHRDGVLLGATRTERERPDLGGPFGFSITLGEAVDPALIARGALTVTARAEDGAAAPLTWNPPLLETLRARHIGCQLAMLDGAGMTEALRFAAAESATAADRTPARRTAFLRLEKLADWLFADADDGVDLREPLTYLPTAPKTVSLDGSALIGHNGHIYLRAGSNEISEQFELAGDDPLVRDRAGGWAALFRSRAAMLAERGITYVQTVIPEKVSVVPDFWPFPIHTPSPILAALEGEMKRGGDPAYFSAYDALTGSPHRIATYRKIDTHLAWLGTHALYDGLCRAAGVEPPFGRDNEFGHIVVVGDLSDRFPGLPLLERLQVPGGAPLDAAGAGIEEVARHVPADGRHVGAHVHWRNPAAAIDRKLLVFGNSFFEYRLFPTTLSWWFARTFRDYQLVWDYDFDAALIDRARPDIVFGQTIERFLPRVPAT